MTAALVSPFIARMGMIVKGLLISSFLTSGVTGSSLLEAIGKPIELSFPNPQRILGVGGLTYHREIDTWTATSETFVGSSLDDEFPGASTPRFYHMKLDFVENSLEFVSGPISVSESNVDIFTNITSLKLEDAAAYPEPALSSASTPLQKDLWLASEGNSHLATTNVFFSKDYGPPDLNTFDPETYSPSRLLRVDAASGQVLEEATIPSFAQWDGHYDWESTFCTGDRPFQGMHSLSITPSTSDAYDYILFAGFQAALFQDGSSPTYFSGSATRVLTYGLTSPSGDNRREITATYINSFRYDTSHLTLESYHKSARHFNALFGMLALNETSLLMIETEDLTGFSYRKIVNRIFYVEVDSSAIVDHCPSLLNCDIDAPTKYLVWERYDDHHLDGISWGPELDDGRLTVALTFEKDGLHLEQYVLNIDKLNNFEPWEQTNDSSRLLKNRIIASNSGIAIFIALALAQFFFLRHLSSKYQSMDIETTVSTKIEMEEDDASDEKSSSDTTSGKTGQIHSRIIARYAMASAMMNSFLVGGVTFGYSGMVLILRKEGVYSENCSCGSFCAGQKEQLALISTVGFAAAIGSRLFIGLFMDQQGPKTTSVLCCLICFAGFLVLAISDESQLSEVFLPAWVLLSLGGSGLHITGFHFTNLFQGDGKKRASAGISAAFGASSAIFPLMQVFNQYLEINLRSMAIFYSCIVFLITINNLIVQPWNKITAGVPFQPDLNVIHKSWWKRDLKTKPFLTSIGGEIRKFDFWGEAMFYSVSLLLLTHYLSTSSQLMYENGDISFTTNPNDWNDYIIARMASWFNALGFVWFPCVQYILTRFKWSQCYIILAGINIAVIGIILVKNLEIQILGFSLLAFGRLLLFSCHHTYILDVFGIEFFGTLNGISSFIAAILGFTSYPLQLFALVANYSLSFVPIGLCILISIAFPFHLRKRNVLNWAETVSVDPTQFRYPKSVNQVKELVLKNKKIRCAGAMHSCAPLIASDGIIMSLTKMDKIISIDPVNKRVRCQSGVRIHNLCEALAPHGLAVGTLGTIDWQTISGAVMTGTHGGALTIPSLHTFVTSYTIVKTDATVVTVTRESNPRLFSAIAPSMGMLGVVVEMELECTDFQMLEARMVTISFDELASDSVFENFMKSNKYCRVVVYPSINNATIWTANPVASVETAVARGAIDCSDQYINFRDENEKAWLEQYLILCKKGQYMKADALLHKVLRSQQSRLGHYVGQYNHVLCKERNNGIPHADIEFNFDFEKNGQVLKTVKQYCETKRVPYYNFEIRTTRQDDALLSCCHSRDAMWIDFQAKAGKVSTEFFYEIEELLKPIGFRKHWAKGLGNTNPKYIVNEFPMIGEFLKIVKEYDPDGKFRNTEGEIWYQEISELVGERMESHDDERRRSSLRSRHGSMRDTLSIVSGGAVDEDGGRMSRRDSPPPTESICATKSLEYELEY